MRPLLLLTVCALAGCPAPVNEGVWLQQASFEWDLVNHRLSYLELGVTPQGARAAVVGGTSTTGLDPELPEDCDPATCDEFPFEDVAEVRMGWARNVTDRIRYAYGSVDMEVDAAGASQTLEVPLDAAARGRVVPLLAGLKIDTNHELSGGATACYDPALGWHPRRIAIELANPRMSGDRRTALVDVRAWFEAGPSLEEARVCVDEVYDQAVVDMRVDVMLAAGPGRRQHLWMQNQQTFGLGGGPLNPSEQPRPDSSNQGLQLTTGSDIVGWSSLDFQFNHEDPAGGGAYLRTLDLTLETDDRPYALGYASNYSPGTQLHGFSYVFQGTITALETDTPVDRGSIRSEVPITFDDAGALEIAELELGDPRQGG